MSGNEVFLEWLKNTLALRPPKNYYIDSECGVEVVRLCLDFNRNDFNWHRSDESTFWLDVMLKENKVFCVIKISSRSVFICNDTGYISTQKERIDGKDERNFIYEVPDDAKVIGKKSPDKSVDNFYKNCLQFTPGTGTFISERSLALCFEKFTGKSVITFNRQIFYLLNFSDFKENYSFNNDDKIDCFCMGENWGVFNFKFTNKAIELLEADK